MIEIKAYAVYDVTHNQIIKTRTKCAIYQNKTQAKAMLTRVINNMKRDKDCPINNEYQIIELKGELK